MSAPPDVLACLPSRRPPSLHPNHVERPLRFAHPRGPLPAAKFVFRLKPIVHVVTVLGAALAIQIVRALRDFIRRRLALNQTALTRRSVVFLVPAVDRLRRFNMWMLRPP